MRPPLLATAVLVSLSAICAACSSNAWDDPAFGEPFIPESKTARRVGRLFEDAVPSLAFASGGSSLTTSERSIWLVGDLHQGLGSRQREIGPALVITETTGWPGSESTEVVGAALPLPAGAVARYTAGIDGGERTLLHFVGIQPGAAGEPALDYLGAGVAALRDGAVQRLDAGGDWRFFGRGDPAFGMAVVQADHGVTTGMDYVFGVRGDAGTDRVYLARTPHGRTGERDQYTFLGAQGEWSTSVKDAAPLFRAGPGGLSVSWNKHLGGFVAVYAWAVTGDGVRPPRLRVMARLARHPSGPWSAETQLFEARGVHGGGRVKLGHGAREHPQLAHYDGRILFVSVGGGSDPKTGRPQPPRMWRVEFPEVR
jgi:hypothetical protein